MDPRRAFLLGLRLAFVSTVFFAVASYIPAAQRSPWPRFAAPVDPFAKEPPLSLQGVEVRGGELIVRVYRSYSIPFARKVVVNVTVCGEACTFHVFGGRIPPGSAREFSVYMTRERLCEVYISALLDGKLAGFWTHTFSCGEG